MKKNTVKLDPAMKNGYIPAPYVLEEGEKINDFYLEPVLFHNENGPVIGVTTCGVIVKDGLYFKDMDNDGILSPYEDWRLDDETRAKDMVAHLPLNQQAGLVLNTLWNTPLSFTRESAKDENGNIVPSRIFKRYDPSAPPAPGILPGLDMRVDDGQVLEQKLTAVIPELTTDWLVSGKTESPYDVTVGGRRYRVYGTTIRAEDSRGTMLGVLYFVDLTELYQIRDEYIRSRPVVSIILVDNYEELTKNLSETAISGSAYFQAKL